MNKENEKTLTEEIAEKFVVDPDINTNEFTSIEDVAEVAFLFAAFPTNALTGQSLVVSHGWHME